MIAPPSPSDLILVVHTARSRTHFLRRNLYRFVVWFPSCVSHVKPYFCEVNTHHQCSQAQSKSNARSSLLGIYFVAYLIKSFIM